MRPRHWHGAPEEGKSYDVQQTIFPYKCENETKGLEAEGKTGKKKRSWEVWTRFGAGECRKGHEKAAGGLKPEERLDCHKEEKTFCLEKKKRNLTLVSPKW